jgi:hypothetical protein
MTISAFPMQGLRKLHKKRIAHQNSGNEARLNVRGGVFHHPVKKRLIQIKVKQRRRAIEMDDVRNSRRNDPRHIPIHLAAFDAPMTSLPLPADLRRAKRNRNLGAVMDMTLPYGAVLFRGIEAVVAAIQGDIVTGRPGLQPDHELPVYKRRASGLWDHAGHGQCTRRSLILDQPIELRKSPRLDAKDYTSPATSSLRYPAHSRHLLDVQPA